MEHVHLRLVTAEDRDWVIGQHRDLYARHEGFDDSFGPFVASILDDFLAHHDPACEVGWIAEDNGRRLGCIFCSRDADHTARLRMFLLVPEARGRGLGRRLLETCMDYAKSRNYSGMTLFTHESHTAACALYRQYGWRLEKSTPVHSFGQDLVEQWWRYRF